MGKSVFVTVRIKPEIKKKAESVLESLGVTPSEAVTIFYSQIALRQGLPFPVEIPNDLTRKVFEEMETGDSLQSAGSADELMRAIVP